MLSSPTGPSWTRVSPLEVLITRACDPSLPEPNYALHLEVAEHINQKKANSPREAALLLGKLANHRNPHISILALALLDTLAQSCGYPFHLQISTKEFLNELVRRFPERPPPFPGPVMSRILELINTWKEGICSESRWKEDLGNIRDMHRLLIFKGYRFRSDPSASRRAVDSQVSTANLKSADELENEDRQAQSAKLQELIRRGTPRDLAAAQELMKSLAGALPESSKPDYRSQALTELNKLEQKVILLNELLDNVDTTKGEKMVSGDAYDQVSKILTNARPKIQKWIEEAQEGSEDSESLDTFLQINDQINTVLSRYEAFKRGDYSAAANPIPSQYGNSSSNAGVSLIDFDDSDPSSTNGQGGSNTTNDLDGLFGSSGLTNTSAPAQPPGYGDFGLPQQQQSPPVPVQQQPAVQAAQPQPTQPQGNAGYGMAMLLGQTSSFTRPSSTGSRTGTPQGGIALPGTPKATPSPSVPAATPNYFSGASSTPSVNPAAQQPSPFDGMNFGAGGFGGNNGFGGAFQQPAQTQPVLQPQQQQTSQPQQQQPKSNDPFGDLAGLF